MRAECEEFEAEISYARRLLQGKVDIMRHALERRMAGGESRIEALILRLPSILSDGSTPAQAKPGGTGRLARIQPPRHPEKQRRRVERLASEATLARIDELSTDEIAEIVESLSAEETKASEERRRVQKVLDEIHAELVRRYREGSEDPAGLLTS